MYEPPCLVPSEPESPNPFVMIHCIIPHFDWIEDENKITTWKYLGMGLAPDMFVHLN